MHFVSPPCMSHIPRTSFDNNIREEHKWQGSSVCNFYFLCNFLTEGNKGEVLRRWGGKNRIWNNNEDKANNVVVRCDSVQSNTNFLTFHKNILVPSSGWKNKIPEDGGNILFRTARQPVPVTAVMKPHSALLTELFIAGEEVWSVDLHVAHLWHHVDVTHLQVLVTGYGHQLTLHSPRSCHIPCEQYPC